MDLSALDAKYFVDQRVYNCPFCNRRNVVYALADHFEFDWSTTKKCNGYIVWCSSCTKRSMHLSFKVLHTKTQVSVGRYTYAFNTAELDENIFYHVPTSFFVLDDRIPKVLRELITEAEGCLKMNFLTGASACTRKAIYELTVLKGAKGEHYDDKIANLKEMFPTVDPGHFEILAHIKDMTSDKVHEQSWDQWDSPHIKLFLETLKSVLHEMYVVPAERAGRFQKIRALIPQTRVRVDASSVAEPVVPAAEQPSPPSTDGVVPASTDTPIVGP